MSPVDAGSVRVIARAEIPTAEMTILDSRFQFVHRAVGCVDVSLPPGAYLLQYRTGTNVAEVSVVLRPGAGTVDVPSPTLSTRSPAPLAGSAAGARYGTFAQESSRTIHERLAQGGQLLIMVRTSTHDLLTQRSGDSLFDVQLLDADLNVLVDLRNSGKRSEDGSAAACNLELAPGTYLLRYGIGASEKLEQAVVVSDTWHTQVFASSRLFGAGSEYFGPNLPEAAVFMAPVGAGFDPADIDTARAESARIGLAGSCNVAPEGRLREVATESKAIRASLPVAQVRDMLKSKFRSPILGIYGAHLMLIGPECRWDVLGEIIATLKTLVGNHPDVIALTLLTQLEDLTEPYVYELPPMLRNSWTLVVGKSVTQPQLVGHEGYSAAVANRMWGSGGWLVWRAPGAERTRRAAAAGPQVAESEATIGEAIAVLHKYVLESSRALGPHQFRKQVAGDGRLTDTQRAILMHAITTVHQGRLFRHLSGSNDSLVAQASRYLHDLLERFPLADRLTGGVRPDPDVENQFIPQHLVRTLGVPAAALSRALVSLAGTVSEGTGKQTKHR